MERYKISGMSCASCSARVEKAVSSVDGVSSCSVNLLTNSMIVDGTATSDEIISAVQKAGYGASREEEESKSVSSDEKSLEDTQTPIMKKRLIFSLIFLFPLMYISMGHMMWGFPLPESFAVNHIAIGIGELILTIAVMVINQKFFISGFKGIINRAPNMDTLVALGSGAAFVYSTVALFKMTGAEISGNHEMVMNLMHEFYFESAAMILTLITVGKMLESYSKGKTTNALKSLMSLAPKTATVIRNGREVTITADKVRENDIFTVKPGESIAVDGVVIEGASAVDESAITGESIPVDKTVGDEVTSATINQSGFLKCRATRVGRDTTLSQIIKMVSDASATKAPIARIADKVSGIFVPVVITIALVTTVVWLLLGRDIGFALARGIAVLVISCPCALGLATPVAIMVGNGKGAKNGILFKNSSSLEALGKTQIAVLDKTGTITKGEPTVTDIIPFGSYDENQLLELAFSLEKKSEHPLSKAIVQRAQELGVAPFEVTDFKAEIGSGISAKFGESRLFAGNIKYISTVADVDDAIKVQADRLSDEGKTPLFFALDNMTAGIIAVADVIKDDSCEAVKALQNMGIKVVMLTGDNKKTANAIGKIAGVDKVIANVLPDGKDKVVQELMKIGKVAMVGDGINDAPALTRADTGIAIGAGTDIAIESADVVVMKSRLSDVAGAIRLSRATLTNIHENLFWAFIYNIIGIPLAAGVFGFHLNPMIAAGAMSLSSFCVVSNALRLNLFKIYSNKRDRKIKSINIDINFEGEEKAMTKVIKIEGMMCPHCEAHVKEALEALPQVDSATPSHTDANATLVLNSEIDDDTLKAAVEKAGYKFLG